MSARPADADVPAAVRAVFSTNRMQGAWNMAASAQSGDRQAGIEAAARLLEKEGLTLHDVLTAIMTIPAKPAAPTMADAFAGFDIFSGAMRPPARPQPASAPPPRARHRRIVQGADVPVRISGVVKIDDEREYRGGTMLVFHLNDEDSVYGPLVCFSSRNVEVLKHAAAELQRVSLMVRAPQNDRHMPSVTSVMTL